MIKKVLKTTSSSLTGSGVAAASGNACHKDHLGSEGPNSEVGVSDSQRSGDQSTGAVSKVPAEANVCTAEILAGIVKLDGKSNGLVLDEVLVVLVDVVDLGERYGEGNLVWWQRKGCRVMKKVATTIQIWWSAGVQPPVMVKVVEA